MNDDDLTRGLEAWAAATDPADDPITEAAVTHTSGSALPVFTRRRAERRWLAVAAAVLVVVGLAAAVLVTQGDVGDDGVVTDGGGEEVPLGPRTQIVVETPDGAPHEERDVRQRFSLHGPCGTRTVEACAAEVAPIDEGPLRHGTSLIVDQALDPGPWALTLESFECGSAGCLSTDAAGRPEQDASHGSCTTAVEAADRPTVVARALHRGSGVETSCGDLDDVPDLDVPPAWSLRPDLPWLCGTAPSTVVPVERGGDDPAFSCFSDRSTRMAVELPILEEGATTPSREAWWRRPGGVGPTEVFRAPAADGSGAWITTSCSGGSVGTNSETGTDAVHELYDCTDEEELSLDLPPLDDPLAPPPTTAATPTEPATGTAGFPAQSAIVLDVGDLPPMAEAPLFRWDVVTNGNRVRSGQIDRAGVLLVAVDPELNPGSRLTWSPYACAGGCPSAGEGGRPLVGAEPVEGVTASPPTCDLETGSVADGAVLVLRVRGETCEIEVVDEAPELTAPPAWTLRPPTDVRCSIPAGGTAEDAGRCLGDAQTGRVTAEWWTTDEDGAPLIWRVNAMRDVDLVHPGHDGEPWTIEHCTGIGLLDLIPGPEIDGCAPPETMSLEPD